MSRFKIGQKVVCVRVGKLSDNGSLTPHLSKGKVYTVLNINKGCCDAEIDIGLPYVFGSSACHVCDYIGKPEFVWWVAESRFAPIQEDGTSVALSMEIDDYTLEKLELELIEIN